MPLAFAWRRPGILGARPLAGDGMRTSAAEYFGAMVAEYDSLIRRAVPRYDELVARMVEYGPREARRVLELGCGTGNYSAALAQRYPAAELTLVDASDEMLAAAASRLRPRSVTTVSARFEELALEAGRYDLVASCIALHHVRDKEALFGTLRRLTAPGGALVFGDQMRGRTDEHHAWNWGRMVEFWREPGHLTEDEMRSLEEHAAAHDEYAPVHEQMRLIEAAGFADVDCVWRNWMWGIVTARA